MKHSSRLYARALSQLIAQTDRSHEAEKISKNFLALLKRNGDSRKIREIIQLTEIELAHQKGGRHIVVETARPMDDIRKQLKAWLRPEDIVEEKINSTLVAGVRLTIDGETQVDASLKSQLDQLFPATLKH